MRILDQPTVFVLGAGASNPYGLPLASELKGLMVSSITESRSSQLSLDDSLVKEFVEVLRYGSHPTVDILLEKKSKFREIGAYAIALAIMPREQHDNLFPQRDWYGDLFEALDFESNHPDTGLLSVVTLNYDRSFEHFLSKSIDYQCRDDKVDCAHDKRRKLTVIHPHGSLGAYPDVPYGLPGVGENTLHKAATDIKIVSDRLDEAPAFQQAQQVIADAANIIFLGFGYDERTLSALLARANVGEKTFRGTALDVDQPTTARLTELCGGKIEFGDGCTCQEFLKNIGVT